MSVVSINPATETEIERFEPHDANGVEAALATAEVAFKGWRLTDLATRAGILMDTARLLEARKPQLAAHMTAEMGKPLAEAEAEIDKCAWVCRHYADTAERDLADTPVQTDARQAYIRHLPLGPILAVMPWNYPFWQVFRFAAPALMAGNVGLLKHASNVWRCALDIEDVLRDAGLPDGCFQTLLIGAGQVDAVIRDRRVRGVTLTGSGPAGAAVAASAGAAIKPSVLELGGTDAFLVMPSADLETAVEAAVAARMKNTGQSCIAAKRFFVHRQVYDRFREAFVARVEGLLPGDPMDRHTALGPLALQKIRDTLSDQVEASLAAGARRLNRTAALPDRGWYFGPQILENAPQTSPAATAELFGPVAALWPVESLDDAIARANASEFGLGSTLFSQDPREIEQAVRDLEAGSTFINAPVSSDPRLPFGGIKDSGYGRELAADGLLAFTNRKTVSLA